MKTSFMDSRVGIVTGAGGGIGRALVEELLRGGASVLAVDRDRSLLDDLHQDLAAADGSLQLLQADVTDTDQVRACVDQVIKQHGRVDYLANNAGVEGPVRPIEEYSESDFDKLMSINAKGAFLGLKHVLPQMKLQGSGAVVNTASVAGLTGAVGMVGYIASKHALVGITKVAAVEAGPYGVRVNALCPGPVATRMMASIERQFPDPGTARSSVEACIALGRYSTPAEQAKVAAFLLSDDASYVNGATWLVDGGQLASPGGMFK